MILDEEYELAQPQRRRAVPPESETSITEKALTWLNAQEDTFARKRHTGPMGTGGHPDIEGCSAGRSFQVEMKRPGEKPTPRQFAQMRVWQNAGALVGWACSVEHVRQIMARRDDSTWKNPLTAPGAGESRLT